jgi:hypothetical protein
MAIPTGIDIVIEYRGKVAFFKYQDSFALPGVSNIRSGETVQKAALRAVGNYIGQDVDLRGTIALYGPGHAALKPGCSSSLLMAASIRDVGNVYPAETFRKEKGIYFVKPSETCRMEMDPRHRELVRSYFRWKREKSR